MGQVLWAGRGGLLPSPGPWLRGCATHGAAGETIGLTPGCTTLGPDLEVVPARGRNRLKARGHGPRRFLFFFPVPRRGRSPRGRERQGRRRGCRGPAGRTGRAAMLA